jgi:hypothetical protein
VVLRVLQCPDKCRAGDMSRFERIGDYIINNLPHQANGSQANTAAYTSLPNARDSRRVARAHLRESGTNVFPTVTSC